VKVGDLVVYAEKGCQSDPVATLRRAGIIISGPVWPYNHSQDGQNRWEVAWLHTGRTGWWDAWRLEVISESR